VVAADLATAVGTRTLAGLALDVAQVGDLSQEPASGGRLPSAEALAARVAGRQVLGLGAIGKARSRVVEVAGIERLDEIRVLVLELPVHLLDGALLVDLLAVGSGDLPLDVDDIGSLEQVDVRDFIAVVGEDVQNSVGAFGDGLADGKVDDDAVGRLR